MSIEEFINYYASNATQMMWLLGAGASRSAGMPSATDIIWDLKRKYYCLKENQFISDNDLANESVKVKIQAYLEAIGCPKMWDDNEYAEYFELLFKEDLDLQRKYLDEQLHPSKISINSGHKILSALLGTGLARVVFTTNFDSVVENAYASMVGRELHSYNLNGSEGALDALNEERFPIYAKMHGDFRYTKMKNLPEDLKTNDAYIQKAFVNACTRFGLIVCGYSGRDENVMHAFHIALESVNPFPKGLYWMTSLNGWVSSSVKELINKAKAKGVNAHIVEADTFDILLGRLWKQVGGRFLDFDKKIRRSLYENPNVPRYTGAGDYPSIRINALPVLKMPVDCLNIVPIKDLSPQEFKDKLLNSRSSAIAVKGKTILAWGADEEINKIISSQEIKKSNKLSIEQYLSNFNSNPQLVSFYNRAIARAIVNNKPLTLRKFRGRYYAVLKTTDPNFLKLQNWFKNALTPFNSNIRPQTTEVKFAGRVPGIDNTFWMECAEVSLEYFDKQFWLLIKPDIWIEPSENRKDVKEFLKSKRKARYNSIQAKLFDAWKVLLLGEKPVSEICAFKDGTTYNTCFGISTIMAETLKSK